MSAHAHTHVRRLALEVGYRHLDCAALYNNQTIVGKGIADWIASDPSKNKREDLFITSKVHKLTGKGIIPGLLPQLYCVEGLAVCLFLFDYEPLPSVRTFAESISFLFTI